MFLKFYWCSKIRSTYALSDQIEYYMIGRDMGYGTNQTTALQPPLSCTLLIRILMRLQACINTCRCANTS